MENPPSPFERIIVDPATNDTMRFIARAVAARGYTQEGLAKELSGRTHRSITGANVGRHFRSKQPRDETVHMYSQLLGIPREAIDILSHHGLAPARKREWWRLLLSHIGQEGRHFTEGTVKRVRVILQQMDEAKRDRLIREFALSVHSAMWLDPDRYIAEGWPADLSPHIVVVAPFLLPHIDLKRSIRIKKPGERTIHNLWFYLYRASPALQLTVDDVDSIVSHVVSISRARGINVAPMLEYHRRERQQQLRASAGKGKQK